MHDKRQKRFPRDKKGRHLLALVDPAQIIEIYDEDCGGLMTGCSTRIFFPASIPAGERSCSPRSTRERKR